MGGLITHAHRSISSAGAHPTTVGVPPTGRAEQASRKLRPGVVDRALLRGPVVLRIVAHTSSICTVGISFTTICVTSFNCNKERKPDHVK